MQTILDQPETLENNTKIIYAGFWPRLAALLVDLLVLAPLTFGVTYFNITSWKNATLMMIVTVIGIGYKPTMEYLYGATLGKMALNIKVTNLQFEQPNLQAILLRNVFHIVPTLISSLLQISMYSDPAFQSVTGYLEFATYSQQLAHAQLMSSITSLLTLVDGIMLLTDEQKRSLHDRIGGTLVIQKQ